MLAALTGLLATLLAALPGLLRLLSRLLAATLLLTALPWIVLLLLITHCIYSMADRPDI